MSNIDKIRLEIIKMRELAAITAVGNHTDWLESRIATCGDILAFINSLPEETKDAEQAAARYERENRQSVLSSVDIVNAFIDGAKWMRDQMPMPEDTVIFQKGVAEGRRLEREDTPRWRKGYDTERGEKEV